MAIVQIIGASGQAVDMSNVRAWDGESGGIQPPGWYDFTIDEVVQEASSQGNPQLVLSLTVLNGLETEINNGRQTKHWISLTEKAAGRLKNFLDAVGLVVGAEGFDDQDLVGRSFRAEVFESMYTKEDAVNGPTEKTSYKIRKEMSIPAAEGDVPAAAAAPSAPPAQAPAQAAPAQRTAPPKANPPTQQRPPVVQQPRPGQRLPTPGVRK